jgi:hypothetical protein
LIHAFPRKINGSFGILKGLDSVFCWAPFRECHSARSGLGRVVLADDQFYVNDTRKQSFKMPIEACGSLTCVSVVISHIKRI